MKLYKFYVMYRKFGCEPYVALRRAYKAVRHHALPKL
jgi:hypothetical protein